MRIPSIKTKRLILRPFTQGDADSLFLILQEKDILQYFPPSSSPLTRERAERLILNQLKHWEEHKLGWWAVEPRLANQLIGWCGLQFLPETEETEVGFLTSRAFWGQGLTTEAAKASLLYGFEKLGLKCIVGIAHPDNIASQRVLEKIGMAFRTKTRYFGMDCYRYSIKRTSRSNSKDETTHIQVSPKSKP